MLQKMWKEEQEELLHHCDSLTTPSIKSENKIITDHHESGTDRLAGALFLYAPSIYKSIAIISRPPVIGRAAFLRLDRKIEKFLETPCQTAPLIQSK